ncbi:MAG: hypothetical protein SOR61_07800 [Evtepia sp.]|uniref:hypothetical protein n=1 Tax=Evtepia sp. TaxID=2773933 RepID=UPI002A74900A|nr:hypothetical protein [Evtepia sp.]MDY3015066.1 hypothetical protein [Evtepia sp.]
MKASGKKIGVIVVVLVIVLTLLVGMFVIPAMTDRSVAQSDRIQKQAAELIANYQGDYKDDLTQEMVCRDLAYLDRQNFHPEEIAQFNGITAVYTYYTDLGKDGRVATNVCTWKNKGSYYYTLQEGTAEDELKVTPWGWVYANGQKLPG